MLNEAVKMDGDSHVIGGVGLNKRLRREGQHVISARNFSVSPNTLNVGGGGERAEMLGDDDILLFRSYQSPTNMGEIRSNLQNQFGLLRIVIRSRTSISGDSGRWHLFHVL